MTMRWSAVYAYKQLFGQNFISSSAHEFVESVSVHFEIVAELAEILHFSLLSLNIYYYYWRIGKKFKFLLIEQFRNSVSFFLLLPFANARGFRTAIFLSLDLESFAFLFLSPLPLL